MNESVLVETMAEMDTAEVVHSQEDKRAKKYVGPNNEWYDNSPWVNSRSRKEVGIEDFLRSLELPPLPEGNKVYAASGLYDTSNYSSPWEILHGGDFEKKTPFQYTRVERSLRENGGYDYTLFFHRATGETLFEWNTTENPWVIVQRGKNSFELRLPEGPFSGRGKVMLALFKHE